MFITGKKLNAFCVTVGCVQTSSRFSGNYCEYSTRWRSMQSIWLTHRSICVRIARIRWKKKNRTYISETSSFQAPANDPVRWKRAWGCQERSSKLKALPWPEGASGPSSSSSSKFRLSLRPLDFQRIQSTSRERHVSHLCSYKVATKNEHTIFEQIDTRILCLHTFDPAPVLQ